MRATPLSIRLMAWGLAIVTAGSLVSLLGEGQGIILTPVLLVIAIAIFFGARRRSNVALLLVLLLSLLPILGGVSESSFALGTIYSFPHFLPGLYFLVGSLMMIAGSVTAVRRDATESGPDRRPWHKALAAAVVAVLAMPTAVSVAWTLLTPSEVPLRDRVGALPLVMGDDYFRPGELQVEAGDTARVYVRNVGQATHTLTIDELDVDWVIIPGRERIIEIRSPGAGSYRYYCRVSGHEDQRGTLQSR
ncbi:MAG TPA: cupredoxin domain-containing protein [Actinomycetota bacterium]|nr:cupredoxin domain-containing protein [Actinomycetota bacterium]